MSVIETVVKEVIQEVEDNVEAVLLLRLSLWRATGKTLRISLQGDPGQIDQEVTEADSSEGKEEDNSAEWLQKIQIVIQLKVLVCLQIIQQLH